MRPNIRLPWLGFCLLSIALLAVSKSAVGEITKESWIPVSAVALTLASTLGFLAFGWARLQKAAASGKLMKNGRIKQIAIWRTLVGSLAVAVMWFAGTIAAVLVFVAVATN